MPVHLTKYNYQGPHLLRIVRSPSERLPALLTEPAVHLSLMNTMQSQQDEDSVYAMPLSSDDEQLSVKSDHDTDSSAPTKRKRKGDDGSPGNKRARASKQPTRLSQRSQNARKEKESAVSNDLPVLQDWLEESSQPHALRGSQRKQNPNSIADTPDPSTSIFEPVMSQPRSSQSSQSRRKATYGKSHTYGSSVKQNIDPKNLVTVPDVPKQIPRTPRKLRGKTLSVPQNIETSTKSSPSEATQHKTQFFIPDDPSLELTSSLESLDAEDAGNIDYKSGLPFDGTSIDSPLSIISSVTTPTSSIALKDDHEDDIDHLDPAPSGFFRCPICTELVAGSLLGSSKISKKLSIRQQQDICHKHKLSDAQTTWRERGYPEIDWSLLEGKRIPHHLPYLRKVLYRKTNSYYLDSLEQNIKNSNGSVSKLRKYFLDGIMDVVKQGYYGPKGAKIMSQIITEKFPKQLKMQLRADKTVATAGVAGFISAVMLPELCQQIVMEDLGTTDQEEARRVMSESNDVGMLMHPDDDHIENYET